MRFYSIFPNAIREPQKLSNPFPLDEHGGNFASVLRHISKNSPTTMQTIKNALRQLVPSVSDLRVNSVGGYLVTRLKHDAAGKDGSAWFDLSQESDGTLRLLGLLVALYQRPRPTFIGIEEPELTVHPGTVRVLGDILVEASRRCQLLITTHSPDLLDQLSVESLRLVELAKGSTTVDSVSQTQVEAVRQNLFSPGELHRMGELNLRN
jgi:predicted ATPase